MGRTRLVLAVDGGNSKTDVVVVSEHGDVLATARSGGFTPQRDGVGAALDVVTAALATLPAGVPRAGFDHVSACLAGADLPVEEEALARSSPPAASARTWWCSTTRSRCCGRGRRPRGGGRGVRGGHQRGRRLPRR
ncbi:hypothetical protein ACFQYP_25235 [Nonomuraea antimicrobica]